jgi:hypothetical protein
VRPYYWKERIFIALLCAGAVLVLSLGGCDRPVDVAACYQKCHALNAACNSLTFARHLNPINDEATTCQCVCTFAMPFADGGQP